MKTCNGVSHIALHAAVTYLTYNVLYYKMNAFMQLYKLLQKKEVPIILNPDAEKIIAPVGKMKIRVFFCMLLTEKKSLHHLGSFP